MDSKSLKKQALTTFAHAMCKRILSSKPKVLHPEAMVLLSLFSTDSELKILCFKNGLVIAPMGFLE